MLTLVSWELHHGPIPDGLCVLHRCDTPACVNPGHLFVGTKGDNNRDMGAKGRHRLQRAPGMYRGEANPRSKLTDAQRDEIVARYRAGGVTHAALASEYAISRVVVGKIVRGWVPEAEQLRDLHARLTAQGVVTGEAIR